MLSRFGPRAVMTAGSLLGIVATMGLRLLNEVGAGVGLGVGRGPRLGEPLDHGITEGH